MDSQDSANWTPLISQLYEQSVDDSDSIDSTENEEHLAALFTHFQVPPDRYEVGEPLGRGGWKEVFLAFDKHCGREVAFALPSDPKSSDIVEAFLREARIIASLEHPGIISLYGMGLTVDGVPFYAMEKQLGGSLRNSLKQGLIEAEQGLEIFLQVCHAIAYSHLMGIVHLDLKPENIQVGSHGVVKVCDWGLSATIQRPSKEHKVSTVFFDLCGDNGDFSRALGTPGYIPPERKTQHTPADPSADIFALGVILKEISKLFPRARRRRLAAIAARASHESAASRYETVGKLQVDLKHFLSLLPTSVEPGGIFSRIGLFIRRHQLPVTYAAASCAFIAIISALALGLHQRAQQEVTHAQLAEIEAQRRQHRAESETLITHNKRVKNAFEQSAILLDLVLMNPSLSEKAVSESIALLNEVIDSSTEEETILLARSELGTAYFIAQQFDEAATAFAGGELNRDLEAIALQFASHPKENGILETTSFIQLLKAVPRERILLQHKMVFYDRSIRANWNENVQITLTWLENKNPKWSAKNTRWSEEKKSLIFKGKGLKNMTGSPEKFSSFAKNILKGLDLTVIRFQGTGFASYGQLFGLNLSTLDVSKENKPNIESLKVLGSEVKIILPRHSQNKGKLR